MARHQSKSDAKINISSQLNKEDDLNVSQVSIPEIPADILFPEELNQYLKGQIQFLTHANGMLQKTLSEKESILKDNKNTISDLNTKILDYEKITANTKFELNGDISHLMSAKIVELSKKVRDKTAENESLKTKCSKLQLKIFSIENNKQKDEIENKETVAVEKTPDLTEEIKILQEKLSRTTSKLFEVKDINFQLRNEMKTANKILQQELGDNFTTVQNIANGQSSWRGRAQQILNLQQKNSELLEKLSQCETVSESTSNNKIDNRKQMIEQQQKELNVIKNLLEETRKKLSGARARTKVLETECYGLKSKLNSITEKCNHDQELIKLLSNQISCMEETHNDLRKENQNMVKKKDDENNNLKIEISKEKCMIENLRRTIGEKDTRINELETELRFGIGPSRSNISICSPDLIKENNRIKQMEVEVERLLDLIAVLNSRLEEERSKMLETQLNYRKEKQKSTKLETKLSRIELEASMTKLPVYSKFGSKISVANSINTESSQLNLENLKNSLELAEENISVLKTRLEITQREKELDFQRFSAIISETSGITRYNTTVMAGKVKEN